MRLRLSSVLLLAALLSFSSGTAQAEDDGVPAYKAKYAYMVETSTGTVLLSKNKAEPFFPASLTKLMTLDVVFQALKNGQIALADEYQVSEHAWRTGGAPSRTATMFAALKSKVSVGDLVQGVAVDQANDACIILAEGLSGQESTFVNLMNARAKAIGMDHSRFANATGLPEEGSPAQAQSTAFDMALLATDLTKQTAYYPNFARADFTWNKITQRNKNPLLNENIGVDGQMTGFSEADGYAIVASAARDDKRVILVLGGLPSEKDRSNDAKNLLTWALGDFETRKLFESGAKVGEASIYGGAAEAVGLVLHSGVEVFIPKARAKQLSAQIAYKWPIKAPVAAGAELATLRVLDNEHVVREVPLFAGESVQAGSLRHRAFDAAIEWSGSAVQSLLLKVLAKH